MSIQTKLETLRRFLEAKTVRCPNCNPMPDTHLPPIPHCFQCHGSGFVVDPAYAPLLEVVREQCPCSLATDLTGSYLPYEEHLLLCKTCWVRGEHTSDCACGGTGFFTRSWEGWPPGALTGTLFGALWKAGYREASLRSVETPAQKVLADALERVKRVIVHGWAREDNPDGAALDAVIEALRI